MDSKFVWSNLVMSKLAGKCLMTGHYIISSEQLLLVLSGIDIFHRQYGICLKYCGITKSLQYMQMVLKTIITTFTSLLKRCGAIQRS